MTRLSGRLTFQRKFVAARFATDVKAVRFPGCCDAITQDRLAPAMIRRRRWILRNPPLLESGSKGVGDGFGIAESRRQWRWWRYGNHAHITGKANTPRVITHTTLTKFCSHFTFGG